VKKQTEIKPPQQQTANNKDRLIKQRAIEGEHN
jgi:hypothetical protein